MKWKPQSREALRVASIMMGPLFEGDSTGPRPGRVEMRCSITVNTWPRLIGWRPAFASAVTAWLPESSWSTRRSTCSRSASSPSFVMTWSFQTFSKNVRLSPRAPLRGDGPGSNFSGIPLFELLELVGIEDLLAFREHHQL